MWHRPALILIGVVLIAGLLFFLLATQQRSFTQAVDISEFKPAKNHLAPDFTLKNLNQESVTLSALRGKPVILNFWDTPCPACRQEMAALQEFYVKNQNRVHLLAINIGESPLVIGRFLQQGGYSFPVLLDGDSKVTQSYALRYTPMAFAIDANGFIREIQVGAKTVAILNDLLEKAEKVR
ncbi:MAG: TlpA family protein disulfide reductase [Firmicutes bacterium]|nr:TlpA family protein disulfide reductase [Bacillota bacterium]MCL5038695.1 TlpA family protein disulfide reductase [Bacillota bacterium]